jgi:hypothetical protein
MKISTTHLHKSSDYEHSLAVESDGPYQPDERWELVSAWISAFAGMKDPFPMAAGRDGPALE